MKLIKLKDGAQAKVDDEDFDWLSKFNWNRQLGASRGYARCGVGGKVLLMHRVIMHCSPNQSVDHINHDKLDNRKANLRVVSQSDNMANARKTAKPKSSKFKGVNRRKKNGRWRAELFKHGVYYYLGDYSTEVEAAQAYNKKALEMSGACAHLNEVAG